MSAPAIRTIKVKDILNGRLYRFEMDLNTVYDYTFDFTGTMPSTASVLDSMTATMPTGFTALNGPTVSGLTATVKIGAAAAVVGTDYTLTVRGNEDLLSSSGVKVEASIIIAVRNL